MASSTRRTALPACGESGVIPGLVPGIHLPPCSEACCGLDPGNKCRDDNVRTLGVTTLAAAAIAAAAIAGIGGTAPQAVAGDAAAGRQKAVQCQACHGLDGLAKIPGAPHLAGQVEEYLVKAMRAYRSGERKDEMMAVAARQLSDDDVENLAAYYAGLASKGKADP